MTGLFWKRNAAGTPYLHNPDESQHTGFAGNCPKRRNAPVPVPAPVPEEPYNRNYGGVILPEPVMPVPAPVPVPVPVKPVEPAKPNDAGKALFDLIEPHVTERIREELANVEPGKHVIVHDVVLRDKEYNEVARIEGAHPMLATVINRAGLREFNQMLVGPAGSGKTYAAEMVSKILGLEYYPMSVGPQTSKSDLMGFLSGKDGTYIPSVVYTAYRDGGVFLLDELDAGNPGVLTTLNGVLSGSPVRFPNGELVRKHKDFICVAAANTVGYGPNARYNGRNRLDGSTTSRFVRVEWDYSEELERGYAATQPEWFTFVRGLRACADTLNMDYIFCSRKIQQGTALLDAGEPLADVERDVIWMGITADDKAKLLAALRARQ
jgi:MoxR-like ATPase